MSLSVGIPNLEDTGLYQVLSKIITKAIDGTRSPLFVDEVNTRVIVGAIAASASPARCEVVGGDVKVVTAGYGVIVSNRGGTRFYRLIVENDGAISADPL